jgi:pyruvate,water dikinase
MFSCKDIISMSITQIQNLGMGIKAKNLVWMAKNGFHKHIPRFFILTRELCDQIIKMKDISLDIAYRVEKLVSEMDTNCFFVRSSAQYEDKLGIPSAGLFLTIGMVPSKELSQAIVNVILNSRDQKVIKILGFYPSISIIIQKMIYPKYSGVLFTKHPVTNDDALIVIEAGYGMGETVVSGRFETDHYEIEKINPLKIKKSKLNIKLRFISPKSNSMEELPEDLRKKSVLSNDQIITLSEYAINIEKKYGKPIDLEWAIDIENKIWFLQIRDVQ